MRKTPTTEARDWLETGASIVMKSGDLRHLSGWSRKDGQSEPQNRCHCSVHDLGLGRGKQPLVRAEPFVYGAADGTCECGGLGYSRGQRGNTSACQGSMGGRCAGAKRRDVVCRRG